MSEPVYLVCARADAPVAAPGTVYDRVCARCGEHVMIYPLGQRRLKEMPELIILCSLCFLRDEGDAEVEPVAPIEEMLREAATSKPNPRRWRN